MKIRQLFDSFLRILGMLSLFALLVAAVIWCWPYGSALAWHLRNGNHATFGQYQVPVPRWGHMEHDYPNAIFLTPGSYPLMDVSAGSKVRSSDQLTELAAGKTPYAAIAAGELHGKQRHLLVAGQPTLCVDTVVEITCIPEHDDHGLKLSFWGHREDAPLFYSTLAGITRNMQP